LIVFSFEVSDLTPTVSLVDGRPATTSIAIAECFGKNHKEVLCDIRALIEDCPKEFSERNFALVDYVDAKGEKRPMYNFSEKVYRYRLFILYLNTTRLGSVSKFQA